MDWKTMLAYITGSVDQELLSRNEYLVAENRILRNQFHGGLRLTDGERRTLAEIGKQLGKRALEEVASIVRPETILGWHRKLVARKFDGSMNCAYPGRPRVDEEIEELLDAWPRKIAPGATHCRGDGEPRVSSERPNRSGRGHSRCSTTSRIFTTNEITKGRAICCCSRPAKRRTEWKGPFAVGNGSADSSDTTIGKPHEFLDPTSSEHPHLMRHVLDHLSYSPSLWMHKLRP